MLVADGRRAVAKKASPAGASGELLEGTPYVHLQAIWKRSVHNVIKE